MTSELKYSEGDEVIISVNGDSLTVEVCSVDEDDTIFPYEIAELDAEGWPLWVEWVEAETILCHAADYDGASTDDEDYEWEVETEEELPTAWDVLNQLQADAAIRLEEAQEAVAFNQALVHDLGIAMAALS